MQLSLIDGLQLDFELEISNKQILLSDVLRRKIIIDMAGQDYKSLLYNFPITTLSEFAVA